MPDFYDSAAARLRDEYGFTELHVASLARESVRDAMVDLATRMCPECKRGHMPTPTECETWHEGNYILDVGCDRWHTFQVGCGEARLVDGCRHAQ